MGIRSKIWFVTLSSVTLICLIGRNHFFLGTGLIVGRWVFTFFMLVFLYRSYKLKRSKYLQAALVLILLAIFSEYTWNKVNEVSLQKSSNTKEISLMTYNLFFKNKKTNASIDLIKKSNPDILVVQELTFEWKSRLTKSVGARYPHKKIMARKGTHGIAVYSKFPILSNRLLTNESKLPFAQILELEIGTRKIQLINVHLASPAIAVEHPEDFLELYEANYKLRRGQLEKIHQLISTSKDQTVAQLLIGDLNTTRYEPIYRDLNDDWVDLYAKVGTGWGLNFPNSSQMDPILTLDYVLARGEIKGMELKVLSGGSSDHLPIFARVKI